MIQFLSVSKLYPNDYLALDNVNFEIQSGEFVFFIGPSGSGKTTIIRHLIREENPTQGKIFFDNEDITGFKRGQVYELRRKIGVIFQDYKLVNDKNAYENIAFAMEAAGQKPKDIQETVPYVLDIVGLAHKWNAFPEQLSGGEKQRVAIARALANNPKLLIADEPTGNLDPEAAWDIVQILTKINNWGTTVIMSTHGSDIVDTLGKRVIKLHEGKIVKDLLKGTYKSDDLDIAKVKEQKIKAQGMVSQQENSKDAINRDTKKTKKNKEAKNNIANKKEDNIDSSLEGKSKVKSKSSKSKDKFKLPKVSLTDRRKQSGLTNDDFERNIAQALEKETKKEQARKEIKQKKEDGDVKSFGLSPKLVSILKAFGYDTLDSIRKAGYKKISRIEELSTRDLKKLKEIISNRHPGS